MRITMQDNWHVEVLVQRRYATLAPATKEICERVAEQIDRHVGGVETRVVCDTVAVCSFCKELWSDGADECGCHGEQASLAAQERLDTWADIEPDVEAGAH